MSKRKLEESGLVLDDDSDNESQDNDSQAAEETDSEASIAEDHSSDEDLTSSGDEDEFDDESSDGLEDSQSGVRYEIKDPNADTNEWAEIKEFEEMSVFDGEVNMSASFGPKETPLEYFRMFFNAKIESLVIEQTNKYARSKLGSLKTQKKKSKKLKQATWVDVDSDGLDGFLGK
jgi:hypothetical protein